MRYSVDEMIKMIEDVTDTLEERCFMVSTSISGVQNSYGGSEPTEYLFGNWLMDKPQRYIKCVDDFSDYDDCSVVVVTQRDILNLTKMTVLAAKVGIFEPIGDEPFAYEEVPLNQDTTKALERFVTRVYEETAFCGDNCLHSAALNWSKYLYELATESAAQMFTFARAQYQPSKFDDTQYPAVCASHLSGFESEYFGDNRIAKVYVCKNLMMYVVAADNDDSCGVYLPFLKTLVKEDIIFDDKQRKMNTLDAIDFFIRSAQLI